MVIVGEAARVAAVAEDGRRRDLDRGDAGSGAASPLALGAPPIRMDHSARRRASRSRRTPRSTPTRAAPRSPPPGSAAAGSIYWASALPATNAAIDEPGHVELLVNAIGPPLDRRVLWDEHYHGHRARPGPTPRARRCRRRSRSSRVIGLAADPDGVVPPPAAARRARSAADGAARVHRHDGRALRACRRDDDGRRRGAGPPAAAADRGLGPAGRRRRCRRWPARPPRAPGMSRRIARRRCWPAPARPRPAGPVTAARRPVHRARAAGGEPSRRSPGARRRHPR